MKTSRIPLLLCALLAATTSFADDKKDNAPTGDMIIATVNGTPYSLDLFRLFLLERLQQGQTENTPEFQQQSFDEFMSVIVASQEADRRKLAAEHDVTVALELQRMKLLANAALASMAKDIKPSEDELKKAYDELVKKAGGTEYKARHILVKDEAEAKKIIKELDKKADFAELAKKYSLGPTGKNGGELDWFGANQMVAPFAEAVAKMKPGTYSKTPVQTQFGWHVIELQETRKAEPPSFEDSKPQLTALVQRRKIAEQVVEMRNKAMVELNEEVVKIKPRDDAAAESEKK